MAGVRKQNPCGAATIGIVLPRENRDPEWLPRRVSTRSAGVSDSGSADADADEAADSTTTSTNPETSPAIPRSPSAPSTASTRARRPAHGASDTESAFHCSGIAHAASNCAEAPSAKPYRSRTRASPLSRDPSSKVTSIVTASAAYGAETASGPSA